MVTRLTRCEIEKCLSIEKTTVTSGTSYTYQKGTLRCLITINSAILAPNFFPPLYQWISSCTWMKYWSQRSGHSSANLPSMTWQKAELSNTSRVRNRNIMTNQRQRNKRKKISLIFFQSRRVNRHSESFFVRLNWNNSTFRTFQQGHPANRLANYKRASLYR